MAQATLNLGVNMADLLIDGTFDVACTYTAKYEDGSDANPVPIQGIFRENNDMGVGTDDGQTIERRKQEGNYAFLRCKQSDITEGVKFGDKITDPSGKVWKVYNFKSKASGLFIFFLIDTLRMGGGHRYD